MHEPEQPTATSSNPGEFPAPEITISLRPFTPYDFNRIMQIETASFPLDPYAELDFRRLYGEHPDEFFVAEISGDVVGYVAGSTRRDSGEIQSLAVDPGFRWLGVGKMLTECIVERFRKLGLRRCYLKVRTTNAVAIDLYRRLGFWIVGMLEGYYVDGVDAFLMEKTIY